MINLTGPDQTFRIQALVKCLQVIGHLFGQGFPELPIGGP